MGDRANVFFPKRGSIPESKNGVFLYTHWLGSELPVIVQNVLQRKARWDDPAYLARMVFNAMTRGSEEEETGFGISSELQDNEHPIVVVDCYNQQVGFMPEYVRGIHWFPFDQYITMNDNAILELYRDLR